VQTLTLLPLAISNLVNAYDAESGTLASRANLQNETQDPLGTVCKLIDLGKLVPGDPRFEALGAQMQPIIDQCANIATMIQAPIKDNNRLVLPFGVLTNDTQQNQSVPGTVPGVVSPRLGNSSMPGLEQSYIGGGGQ
jgi:phospholipid/cholesterol/gamma-HCH transport system substrate-binding protein